MGLMIRVVKSSLLKLSKYLPVYESIAWAVGFTPLLGTMQDLSLTYFFGSDGQGISFGGLLYLHEIAAVVALVGFRTSASRQALVQIQALEAELKRIKAPGWGTWIHQVVNPQNLLGRSTWDPENETSLSANPEPGG